MVGLDAIGEEGSVLVHEPEQGRAAGVLPGQAQEVQPGHLGDPATVDDVAFPHHLGEVEPAVVRAVAGRPHHHPDVLQQAVVGEAGGPAVGIHQPGPEPDPLALQPAPVGPDHNVPAAHPPARPGGDRDPQQAEPGQPPEQVPAGQPLGQHRIGGGDGEVDLVGGGQLLGDLEARVAPAHHQHPSRGRAWGLR